MKLLQHIVSSGFRNSRLFSLKTFARDSSCIISTARKSCFNTCILDKHSPSLYFSVNKFFTVQYLQRNTQDFGVSLSKKRLQRKKAQKGKAGLKGEIQSAVAYTSAEQYKIQDLAKAIEHLDLYRCLPLPEDAGDVLHVSTKNGLKESSHMYFFSEGSVVFWNVPACEQEKILKLLKPYEINSYDDSLITEEKEDLDYTFSEDETNIYDGSIILNSSADTDLYTYTFSNSLALSVKLGVLEAALERFCDTIEWVPETMKRGKKIGMSSKEILTKRGELFSLRHTINLNSDFLDAPDFYWDRKDLEILYKKTCNYLDIAKRTKTMNERLGYCSELIDLLNNHMTDKHHVRLEWMIIVLIMVEVVFESIHFVQRF